MLVDLMHVQTADGVRLEGALRTPPAGQSPRLGLDLVICFHGVGGNFYNSSFFDEVGSRLLDEGCAVLRTNSRGHDQVIQAQNRLLGAQYEIIDDCRLDWRAWLDFAEQAGYRRVALWGHSLGAVKTIYYQAQERDPRVVCAIASSPPRFAYDAYAHSEDGEAFLQAMHRAEALVAAGQPEALIEASVPVSRGFAARTYVDKYGRESRYDILEQAPRTPAPLLVTLGELEIDGLAFRDLATHGPTLDAASPLVHYQLIAGADHSYASRVPELWHAARTWLDEVRAPAPAR